jgi:hypothetical protein
LIETRPSQYVTRHLWSRLLLCPLGPLGFRPLVPSLGLVAKESRTRPLRHDQRAPPESPFLVQPSGNLAATGAADVSVCAFGCEVHPGPSRAGPRVSRPSLVERKLLRYRREQFPHVLRRLCRRLKEEKSRLACIGLGVRRWHGSLVGLFSDEVELVARQSDDNVLIRLALEFFYPRLGLVQGRLLFKSVSTLTSGKQKHPETERTACVMS